MDKKVVIIGAGPAGLGAAYRLQELGHKDWAIYEKNNYVGGLSASFRDGRGFTWDVGGHVMFSHYEYFDRLVGRLLERDYLEHWRKAWIWLTDRFVPYPFQNNIRYLPKNAFLECIKGLEEVHGSRTESRNFREWIVNTFGKGIAKYFMTPYNEKVWAYPLNKMSYSWIAERVSIVDPEKISKNARNNHDDVDWGPNNRFKFPLHGGTGGLFGKFTSYVNGHLFLNKEIVKINIKKKEVHFHDGETARYDTLISTMPLNILIKRAVQVDQNVVEASEKLAWNSCYIVGIGIHDICPSDKCWMYFPEDKSPFYRVTYFSNYSPYNVPNGQFYSLMCETAFSKHVRHDKKTIVEKTIAGLISTRLISESDIEKIVSTYLMDVDYAYPIPSLERDQALSVIQPYLMSHDIYSRGRFGAWKYETGNMDHSVMQGVETVDKILLENPEQAWR